jgi:hypothetical protein
VKITNTGQSIWESGNTINLVVEGDNETENSLVLPVLKPFESVLVKLPLSTKQNLEEVTFSVLAKKNDQPLSEPNNYTVRVRNEKSDREWVIGELRSLLESRIRKMIFTSS